MRTDGEHLLRFQRCPYHNARTASTHGEHTSSLGASDHLTPGAVMHQMDELLQICTGVSDRRDDGEPN